MPEKHINFKLPYRPEQDSLEKLPCAAYLMRNNESLTLVTANSSFYRLFDCTEQIMRSRYGSRMGALFHKDSLRGMNVFAGEIHGPAGPVLLKQKIKRGGATAWIQTCISLAQDDEGILLFCVSFDITAEEKKLYKYQNCQKNLRFAANLALFNTFEYDPLTGNAFHFFPKTLFPNGLTGTEKNCPDFINRYLEKSNIFPEDAELFRETFQRAEISTGRSMCEYRMKNAAGGTVWLRLTLSARKIGEQQEGQSLTGLLEDITVQKETLRSYLSESQFYQAMLSEKTAYGHVDVTDDQITRVGGMWNLYNEVINKITYTQLFTEFINKVVHPEDRRHYLELMQRENFMNSLENGIDRLGCEFRRIVDQNKMMWMEISIHLFRDPLSRHVLGLFYLTDIDARKKQELELLHNSSLDLLTNIYNKRTAEMKIRQYLKDAASEELCAFIILDLDNFKAINDTYGHRAGDELLIRLARILTRTFHRDDIIGRFGGDEFIIFISGAGSQRQIAGLLDDFYGVINGDGEREKLSCSMGVSVARGPASYDCLFREADSALYLSKKSGKNQYTFYSESAANDAPVKEPQRRPALPAGKADAVPDGFAPVITAPPQEHDSFDSFISAQGDMAYLVEPDTFELIKGNKAFYDRIGMTPTQCIGMKCYEIMHKRSSPCPFCSKANWSTDKFYLWKNLNTTLEQEFLIKNKLVSWDGRQLLLALAVDISNNKSIVDSIDNDITESHSLLSGVQRMSEAESATDMLYSALETIGYFFHADTVRFWRKEQEKHCYKCICEWSHRGPVRDFPDFHKLDTWLDSQTWKEPVMLESPEAILNESYDLYQYMKRSNIRNQRWIQVRDSVSELGCISIDNISSNLQNIAFLESFRVFMATEFRKRSLVDAANYARLHDDLTGLSSRYSFEDFMSSFNPDRVSCIGVMVANFDNLKGINSNLGYQSGNFFIKQFADMLQGIFPLRTIYRLNGDEFLVIAPNMVRPDMDRNVSALEELVRENGSFSVSIGYAWDDVEKDVALLIEQASQAMYIHKKRHYDAIPATVNTDRRQMLSGLTAALEKREFEVFLQPKVTMADGQVVGAEALIRYRSRTSGIVPPSQFIELLEQNNLIRYIDLFVFEEVCALLERWKRRGVDHQTISLNFSRLTLLERDLPATLENLISHYDVTRSNMEIEITESIANMWKSVLLQSAAELQRAGFHVSLDDFGTKYTNLAILAELDFDVLKLDKSLIGPISSQESRQVIVSNIIHMCEDLGIDVLAEGIETPEQEKILRSMNCYLGQGYLYGKPMPIAEFERKYLSEY